MISNIEYKHNNQEIISLTNSYGVKMEIGQKVNGGIIKRFFDERSYSGNLQNLHVSGTIRVFIEADGTGLKKCDVDAFIPNPYYLLRRKRLLLIK